MMADCIIYNRDVSQTTELQTQLLTSAIRKLEKQLELLNMRTEEAFDTKIDDKDIE